MYVPRYDDHWNTSGWYRPAPAPSITVHALRENRRPIGFAPWPEEEAPAEPKKRKKRKP